MNTYYIPQWFSFKIAKVNCNIWIKKNPFSADIFSSNKGITKFY